MQPSRLIDLAAPAPPRRRLLGGRARLLAAIGLTLPLLLALTGPVHSGPSLTLAWQAEAFNGFLWVQGDAVFTVARAADGLRLIRRELTTGRTRWERPLWGGLVDAYLGMPLTLVPRFPPYPGSPAATIVLDADSARQVGSYPVAAAPLVYIADGVAVTADREPTRAGAGPDEPFDGWREEHWITGLDLATGETRWRRRVAAGRTWALPGVYPWMEGIVGASTPARWMAVVGPGGAVEVWDLATGAATARGEVGPFDSWSYAVALPDALVVNSRALPDMRLTGYEPGFLSVRWRVQLSSPPDVAAWPIECAGPVCLHSPNAVWALDPGSGALLWKQSAVEAYPAGYPMLAALTARGPTLLDVANGTARPLAAGWRIVERQPAGRQLVVSNMDAGRTILAALDQADGALRVLGDVGAIGAPTACHAAATHVACTVGDGLRVWRLSPSVADRPRRTLP